MNAALAIDRNAPVDRTELDGTAWVDLATGFVRDAGERLSAVVASTRWQQGETLRYDKYVPEQRLGAGLRARDHDWLRQIELHLESRYRTQGFVGVAAILYRDGTDWQGLHRDREMRWLDDTLIGIVVLGEARPFVLRRTEGGVPPVGTRVPAGAAPGDIVLHPGHGDLLVMGGTCQRDWMHGIPQCSTALPRVSLTWGWTSKRGRPDTNPTFSDGRHFSDGPRQQSSRRRPV